jgi:hypothetical protein
MVLQRVEQTEIHLRLEFYSYLLFRPHPVSGASKRSIPLVRSSGEPVLAAAIPAVNPFLVHATAISPAVAPFESTKALPASFNLIMKNSPFYWLWCCRCLLCHFSNSLLINTLLLYPVYNPHLLQ